ncbi:SBBP repeat-containing protein [Segetibacter sp. 3557_3]|uniref:SBBP repeat-containing protein n=1 Tax=Segetibacter sp. 3557_3 TaxID=2547429 RepID=UPI00140475EC|nr:SBBP repeat-containing protein [Segetibacter sp. 3557_3]
MTRTLLIGTLLLISYLVQAQPSFNWMKSIEGTAYQSGSFVDTDSAGNVYTTGQFTGTISFSSSAVSNSLTAASSNDIYIARLDASGNLLWAKNIGGPGTITVHSQAIDPNSNLYLLCRIPQGSADVDPGPGITLLTATAQNIIIKLDSAGTLIWAKEMAVGSEGIAADRSGVYFSGFFQGTPDFDPGPGVFNLTAGTRFNMHITKLDSSGMFVWAKNMGNGSQGFLSIAVNTSGIYTSGTYEGTADFDPGPATVNLTSLGRRDLFITKSDLQGNLIWAKTSTGSNESSPAFTHIRVAPDGDIYAAGTFTGTIDFNPEPETTYSTSNDGIFMLRFDSSGKLRWGRNLPGPSARLRSIAVDASGIHGTGWLFNTEDFDPGPGVSTLTSAGSSDFFIFKLDGTGNLEWAKNIGGPLADWSNSIVLDRSGGIFVTGYFSGSVDFDPRTGTNIATSAGNEDAFLLKLQQSVTLPLRLRNLTASLNGSQVVDLRWQTLAEVNTARFVVERSLNGRIFSTAGSLNATSSPLLNDYELADHIAAIPAGTQTLFYRLKMVDKDGSFTYSPVVAVRLTGNEILLQILQNPVADHLNLQVAARGQTVTLSVVDNAGRMLKQSTLKTTGATFLSLDISSLPKGKYYLTARSEDGEQQVKDFMKF